MARSARPAIRPAAFPLPGGHALLPPHIVSNAPILNTAPVIRWLVGANVAVYVLQLLLPPVFQAAIIHRLAFYSYRYTLAGGFTIDPPAYIAGPFTYMYLHGGLLHLLVNMAVLLAFGTAIARQTTGFAFFLLYTFCGIFGAIAWMFIHPYSGDPVLGASGAISGMVGAVGRISLGSPGTHDMPFRSRGVALMFVAMWLVLNFVFGVIGGALFGLEGEVAWEAHLGGFVAGFVLVPLFMRGRRPHWP